MHRNKIPGMGAVRGISAIAVVCFHLVTPRAPGRQSVVMFFVLSGLLITWTLLTEERRTGRIDVGAFYLRRALRLLPAMAVMLMWLVVTGIPRASPRYLIAAALYVSNYLYAVTGTPQSTLVHTWSLGVEEHFYLVWPLIFRWASRGRLLWIAAGLAIGSGALRVIVALAGASNYAAFATETNAAAILTGCALAVWIWQSHERLPRILFYRPLGALALLATLGYAQLPHIVPLDILTIPLLAIVLLQAITF